ncbi:MAG: hypothetical protein IRZ16_06050 [Myxococcaceae bacterium]|nr:hypothetical protein [Myxococcaceae bacterium]
MTRRPRGYIGINHQTIGSDILAVLKALHLPEQTLGKAQAQALAAIEPDRWYPIAMLLDALETLDQKLDTWALRSVGWELFRLSHAEEMKKVARSARDIVYGIDGMYHRANRGSHIGGWTVLRFEPGLAELEKTTPHHCVVEEGILQEALRSLGITANVEQTRCFRRGDDACLFHLTSTVTDQRWTG